MLFFPEVAASPLLALLLRRAWAVLISVWMWPWGLVYGGDPMLAISMLLSFLVATP